MAHNAFQKQTKKHKSSASGADGARGGAPRAAQGSKARGAAAKRRESRRFWLPWLLPAILLGAGLWLTARFLHAQETPAPQSAAQAAGAASAPGELPAEVEGTPVCGAGKDAWNLVLVNAQQPLPEGFSVELLELREGQAVDARIYPQLQAMMDACRAAGGAPLICSSYRTAEKQEQLHQGYVQGYLDQGFSAQDAEAEASRWSAVSGQSEHQTGLAVDIVAESNQTLDASQATTAEQRWLMKNCWKYGFILRYPTDKSERTGIGYEPWHYRYVGVAAAQAIVQSGVCLEEYVAALPA